MRHERRCGPGGGPPAPHPALGGGTCPPDPPPPPRSWAPRPRRVADGAPLGQARRDHHLSPYGFDRAPEPRRAPLGAEWQHQLRLYLPGGLAGLARTDPGAPALRPLADVLDAHGATLVSQLDAFEA